MFYRWIRMQFDTMPLGERWITVNRETISILNINPGIVFRESEQIRRIAERLGTGIDAVITF